MGEDRFLVIDDDAAMVRRLAHMIRPFGETVPAGTCQQAEALIAEDPDWTALIVDYQLPDGSGLELLARTRPRIPFVGALVLTGHNDRDSANAAYDLDAEYLVKPAESDRITRFLMRASVTTNGAPFLGQIQRVVHASASAYGLSVAETDVLRRAALGESREDIARARDVSCQTINKHVTNLLRRTGDRSLHHAVERLLREAGRLSIP